jgi:DNA segregation ATPase FtsK/SpoIIIE, S-DNA-T family
MAKKQIKKSSLPPEKEKMSPETVGFLTLSIALMLFISLISFAIKPETHNLLGLVGHLFAKGFHSLFGLTSYTVCLYLFWVGYKKLLNKPILYQKRDFTYFFIALLSAGILLNMIEDTWPNLNNLLGSFFYPGLFIQKQHYHLGGAPLFYLYRDLPIYNLTHILNSLGTALIFSTTLVASLLLLFEVPLERFIARLTQRKEKSNEITSTPPKPNTEPFESDFLRFVKLRIPGTNTQEKSSMIPTTPQDMLAIQPEKNPTIRPSISRKEQHDSPSTERPAPIPEFNNDLPRRKIENDKRVESPHKKREAAITAQKIHNGDFTDFQLPSPNLLTNPKKIDQTHLKRDLKRQAEVLEETLLSFGIEAKVGQINCGPTITSFEIHPAIGVKVQKIKTLDNDIALNMEAKSIRIIAPIPGKAAVGIEVPNPQPQEVGFKDMLLAYQQAAQKFHIPILLGKAVNGDYIMSDLAKMPHCIIAGATGSGKSVCINTIVMSIIMNAKPDQIKLIMVDPKKVELTPYTNLPHMLAPVITEPRGAAAALNWLVKEMESRYDILKLVGVRNIDSFNKRTPNLEQEAASGKEIPPHLPYIVGIIDELADLMMVASQDIETPIARIAQMARAVGIHLILATQRPSREVITGLIKANFPTRISFKVASRVNSQIVLDETGAESLLGNGDMLFLPPGTSTLTRLQGAFIRDEDIQSVVEEVCKQAPPNYLIHSFDQSQSDSSSGKEDLGDLYHQAYELITSTGNASTTFLQRKLKIGYPTAAGLMDQLENQGVVGPSEGSKPRKILARRPSSTPIGEIDFETADLTN